MAEIVAAEVVVEGTLRPGHAAIAQERDATTLVAGMQRQPRHGAADFEAQVEAGPEARSADFEAARFFGHVRVVDKKKESAVQGTTEGTLLLGLSG